ncbi:MAG: hypothetical protein ACTSWN_05130 [Promethearchaeota archaeon]
MSNYITYNIYKILSGIVHAFASLGPASWHRHSFSILGIMQEIKVSIFHFELFAHPVTRIAGLYARKLAMKSLSIKLQGH